MCCSIPVGSWVDISGAMRRLGQAVTIVDPSKTLDPKLQA